MNVRIEEWKQEHIPQIYRLIENTFLKSIAPGLTVRGVKTFFDGVSDDILRRDFERYKGYVAFDLDKVIGFIAVDINCHVAFLFVDIDYQNMGAGRSLTETIERYCRNQASKKIEVYSSLNAVGMYERLGFTKKGNIQEINGLRFQPMVKQL